MRYNNAQKEAIISAYLALPTVGANKLDEGNYTKDTSFLAETGEINLYLGECKAIDYGEDGLVTLVWNGNRITINIAVEQEELESTLRESIERLLLNKPAGVSEAHFKKFEEFCIKILTDANLLDAQAEEEFTDIGSVEDMLEHICVDGRLILTDAQEKKIRTTYLNLGTIDATTKIYEQKLNSNSSGVKFFDYLLFSGICNAIIGSNSKLWCLVGYTNVTIFDERRENIIPRVTEALDKLLTEGAACCKEEQYRLFIRFCANTLYEEMLDKKEPSEELNLALAYIKDLDKLGAYKYEIGSSERHKLLNMIKRHKTDSSCNNKINNMKLF